jgi:hypothetical protein
VTPCYTRHEIAPGVHQDIPHEHEKAVAVLYNKLNDFEPKPKPPSADTSGAEERNKRALHEISRQRTEDAISIHRIERILRGET